MRVGHDIDARRTPLARSSLRVFDESASEPFAHPVWFDKQAIQFAGISSAVEQDGEADDHATLFRDPDMTRRDLFRGQCDRVRVSRELCAVHRVVHRGAALKLLQRATFRRVGAAKGRGISRHQHTTLLGYTVSVAVSVASLRGDQLDQVDVGRYRE